MHERTGPVSFGAEVSCPNICFSTCPKIKWFGPYINFLPKNFNLNNYSRGAATPRQLPCTRMGL